MRTPLIVFALNLVTAAMTFAATAPRDEVGLRKALAAASDRAYATVAINRPLSISSDLTVPRNVSLRFEDGGSLSVAAGKALLINGSLEAPLQPVFNGEGRVQFGHGRVPEIYPQWWGACGDGEHDDTKAIRAAVRALPPPLADPPSTSAIEGGTVYLPPGKYVVTGTIDVASGLTLRGANATASVIVYIAPTGSCLKMPADCIDFSIEHLALRARPENSAIGVDGSTPYVRYFRMDHFSVTGFHTGIYIPQGLHLTLREGYIGCYGLGEANGTVGLKLGNLEEDKACTTATVSDVYFSNAQTCMYNRAAPCLLLRPIFESCGVGLDSYTRAAIVEPFFAACKVDARLTANGVLFVGPYPTEHKIEYSDPAIEARTSFLPDTFDTYMKLGRMGFPANGPLTFDGQPLIPEPPR